MPTRPAVSGSIRPQDFDRAVATLEALPPGPDTDAQWRVLAAAAQAHEQLGVAERCAAALGDVARVEFLHKVGWLGGQCCWQIPGEEGLRGAQARAGLVEGGATPCACCVYKRSS